MTRISNEAEIINKFFSDKEKAIRLEKGTTLLDQNVLNHRLFYVAKGKLRGFLQDEKVEDPTFEANKGDFVGVYSFFSKDHKSYTQLKAIEDTTVFYIEEDPFSVPGKDGRLLVEFLFGVVVKELRSRQKFAGKMAKDRQLSLKKLIKSEKMALLGQLSSGLAHELNNALASLSSNLERLIEKLKKTYSGSDNLFQKGLLEGQKLSSKEVRSRKALFMKKDWNQHSTSTFAKIDLPLNELEQLLLKNNAKPESLAERWDLGHLLHDIRLATSQSEHVLSSVKNLGVANQQWSIAVDVTKTVKDSVTLIAANSKSVNINIQSEEKIPLIQASSGELMQVWINLIKNAIESLVLNKTKEPSISISIENEDEEILVRILDNGPGIPRQVMNKIFLPNFTTKVGGLSFGLGIGLSIVERIIQDHDGTINVFSQPGETTFEVRLPVINESQ